MAERGVNKVILVGNLGQAPEVRYMPNGGAVANLSLATSETWRDKATGEPKEKIEWHRVVVFGKLAEVAREYLTKGAKVYIEGQLQTRKWEDDQGNDHHTTEIVVNTRGSMQMLGGGTQNERQTSGNVPAQPPTAAQPAASSAPAKGKRTTKGKDAPKGAAAAQTPSAPPQQPQGGDYPPMDFEDDIPF